MHPDKLECKSMEPLKIEVWSDIACPWCWIGKRGLDAALEQFNQPVSLRWRAFELNPKAALEPPQIVDYAQRLADKYGLSRDAAQEMIDRMVSTGQERGVNLRFDRIRPTNTFNAHRLLHWAHNNGNQTALKEAIFKAYFNEGRLVSDLDVLLDLAEQVGLDPAAARAVLQSDAFTAEVRQDEQLAAQIGISGVPCFVFPQVRSGLSGAQPAEVLLEAMRKAHEQLVGLESSGP